MNLSDNLKKIMETKGLNPYDLSRETGVNQSQIHKISTGETKNPGIDSVLKLAKALKVTVDTLVGGGDDAHQVGSEEKELSSNYVYVPRYDVQASAGEGAIVHSEQIVDHLAFKRDWVQNALGIPLDALALISVRGDSMEPTLSNGDLILIDLRAKRIDADSIYVLQLNGSLLVKRVQRNFDGSIEITSDNPRYRPSVLQGEGADSLGLIGRVVWCGRRM